MRFFLLLASLLGGILASYLSVIGGIWYVAPVFIIIAIVVAFALDNASRWRIAAFSVGMLAVFAVEVSSLVHDVTVRQARAQQKLAQERLKK